MYFLTPPRYHEFIRVTYKRDASLRKSHLLEQPSFHVVHIGVRLCRRLPLLHDTPVCVSRCLGRRVAPQSNRRACETLTGELFH